MKYEDDDNDEIILHFGNVKVLIMRYIISLARARPQFVLYTNLNKFQCLQFYHWYTNNIVYLHFVYSIYIMWTLNKKEIKREEEKTAPKARS